MNDGNQRWAIAPPPPTSATDRAHSPEPAHPPRAEQRAQSGEFSLSLDEDLLDPESEIFSRRLQSSLVPSLLHGQSAAAYTGSNAAHPTLAPPELEPFDSERLTEIPGPSSAGLAALEREVPTIPAAPLDELDLAGLAVPPVPTGRGFFLESVRLDPQTKQDQEPGSTRSAPSVTPLVDLNIEFDVDEGL